MRKRLIVKEETIMNTLSEVIDELTGADPEGLKINSDTLPELLLNYKFSDDPNDMIKIQKILFFVQERLYDLNELLGIELNYRHKMIKKSLEKRKF